MKQTMIFQMLSDTTRLRALALMQNQDELCVCELVHALELSQPKISRHLAAMRDAGLVGSRRNAQWIFYFIQPGLADWQRQVLEGALTGITDEDIIKRDQLKLDEMKNRPERASAA